MSAAEESQAWHTWQQQVMQQRMAAAAVREQIEAEEEEQARIARLEAKRDPEVDAFRMGLTGQPVRTIRSVLHDMAQIPDRPWYDPQAEPGTKDNPVRLDAAPPSAERSQRPSDTDRLLARTRAVDAEFRRHEARWHEAKLELHRSQAVEGAKPPLVGRYVDGGAVVEISR